MLVVRYGAFNECFASVGVHSVTASTYLCSLLFNACSNKLSKLHHLLYNVGYDHLLITETWLHIDIPPSLLDPNSEYVLCVKIGLVLKVVVYVH